MNMQERTLLFIITAVLLSGCHAHMSSYSSAPTDDSLPPVGLTSDGQYLMGIPQSGGRVNYYDPQKGEHYIGLHGTSGNQNLYNMRTGDVLIGSQSSGGSSYFYNTTLPSNTAP